VAEYRVVIGDAARDLLRKPGVVFTCRGYQFRTVGNDLLECWGQGLTGELDWQQARMFIGQELVDRAVQVRLNRVADYVAGVEGSEF